MSEHTHEWEMFAEARGDPYAQCRHYSECKGLLLPEEIERRLNATERLSAENADSIADLLGDGSPKRFDLYDLLREYAAALDGADG